MLTLIKIIPYICIPLGILFIISGIHTRIYLQNEKIAKEKSKLTSEECSHEMVVYPSNLLNTLLEKSQTDSPSKRDYHDFYEIVEQTIRLTCLSISATEQILEFNGIKLKNKNNTNLNNNYSAILKILNINSTPQSQARSYSEIQKCLI